MTEIGSQRINTALRNVNALLRLSTNLINFERADVYSSELHISEYELNTYMNEIYKSFRSYANIKHIDFTYKSDFNYLNVWFDSDKMGSILKNILSNALKYTVEGSISIYMEDDWLVIEDTGIGICSEDLPRIFEKGFTGYNGRSDKKSTGIGLYLCKQIIEKLRCQIRVESKLGKGTRVLLHLMKEKLPVE